MQKIVINSCYGGFSLSPLAVEKYAERKGLTVHWFVHNIKAGKGFDEGMEPLARRPNNSFVDDKGIAFAYTNVNEDGTPDEEAYFDTRPEQRADPDLVAVVEELGEQANGLHAQLKIIEIPDHVKWVIEEYDGNETVAEEHRSWAFMTAGAVEAGVPVRHMGRFSRVWVTISATIRRRVKAVFRRKPKAPPRARGRTGFIQYEAEIGFGYWLQEVDLTYELEELEMIGDQSRVSVVNLTGLPRNSRRYREAWSAVSGTLVPTDHIRWRS